MRQRDPPVSPGGLFIAKLPTEAALPADALTSRDARTVAGVMPARQSTLMPLAARARGAMRPFNPTGTKGVIAANAARWATLCTLVVLAVILSLIDRRNRSHPAGQRNVPGLGGLSILSPP